MLTANKLMPQGRGLAPVLLKRAATIELDWDVRQKSRFDATDSQGRQIGIFLPRGTAVRGGDVLVAEDGSLVRVIAAPQPVLRITHCTAHGTPFDLTRAAYHLGNRHVPIELKPDHLKIEPDHVLADMLRSMHLIVVAVEEAFEPEGGAYGSQGHSHGGHSHDHGHDHGKSGPKPLVLAPNCSTTITATTTRTTTHGHALKCPTALPCAGHWVLPQRNQGGGRSPGDIRGGKYPVACARALNSGAR
ncbi:urease accessory protein UreE [Variovorax paradoxus]|uniref:urease accessory protein UreE n=1 Tax=Variovorax paradoxus TaxID=34073 RepID=UPI001D1771BF|nr:urease accessory protein UreE [Variovorax paradoxus]